MKKRAYIVLLLVFIFTFSFQSAAYAADPPTPIIGYKLSGGVGNYGGANTRYYFIHSSAKDMSHNGINNLDYTPYIDDAMYRWVHTTSVPGVTTPISFKSTLIQQNSVIDVYAMNNRLTGWAGYTHHMVGSYEVNGRVQDWNWCKVELNAYFLQFDGLLDDIKKAAAHEFGHCFGLDENTETTNSTMYKWVEDIARIGPSAEDCKAVNRIYVK